MKKVLIISPHFPPVNAPDMQRVRFALPYLRGHGWEPTVLAIAPESIEGGVREPLLETTYPADIRVVRVRGIPATWTRWAGVGNLWWRCGRALAAAGERLLRAEKFDLVFFSTTQFDACALGPRWRARFGVPYVMDYQDPWVDDYYARTGTRPPGGRLKYAVSQWQARRKEETVLRGAGGVIAVSEAYGPMLARLYPWFDPAGVRVLPFGASPADFEALRGRRPERPLVDFDDGLEHYVYTGRAGDDMALALTVVFRAFRRFRAAEPARAAKVRFHFIGTSYAPPPLGREFVAPIARAEGVGDAVAEHCYRVPYFDALYYLSRAHALVAVGSDDPSYSASKIFPYILARRPLLLVFHRRSPVLRFAEQTGAGLRFAFDGPPDVDALADEVCRRWFAPAGPRAAGEFDAAAFAPFTAEAMTARLAEVFARATEDGR